MTAYSWSLAANGDWHNKSRWTPAGGPPTSANSATIAATGKNYVVNVTSTDVASSLTLSSANATLLDQGAALGAASSLTIGGTLAMSAGTLNLATAYSNLYTGVLTVGGPLDLSGGFLNVNNGGTLNLGGTLRQTGGTLTLNGGTIAGGKIKSTGGTVNLEAGTLSGVTFDGPLNLISYTASVHLANGARVVGSSGSGPGTINVTAGYLYFDGTQTVSNETINLGTSIYAGGLYAYHPADTGDLVLTLASSVTVDATGIGEISDGGGWGDGFVNHGVIEQTGSSPDLIILGNAFTNSGTIELSSTNGKSYIEPTTFTNRGTIDVANGNSLTIAPVTNSSSMTTASFTTTASSLLAIEANSAVTIEFLLGDKFARIAWTNNGSITLASGASLTLDAGTINNGAIQLGGGTLTIGADTAFHNKKTVTQSGGSVTLGDASRKGAAQLFNAPNATWDITDDSGIGLGPSTSSSITNSGLFEKTGGTGTSVIAPSFANADNLLVSSGTLDFEAAVTGTGTDTISGGSTLEFELDARRQPDDRLLWQRRDARSDQSAGLRWFGHRRLRRGRHGRPRRIVVPAELQREFRRHARNPDRDERDKQRLPQLPRQFHLEQFHHRTRDEGGHDHRTFVTPLVCAGWAQPSKPRPPNLRAAALIDQPSVTEKRMAGAEFGFLSALLVGRGAPSPRSATCGSIACDQRVRPSKH